MAGTEQGTRMRINADKTTSPVPSIAELRRLVQEPVAHRNDMTGRMYGSRLSIHITRFFLLRGWHADLASGLMLLNGLAGSLLLAFSGWYAVLGFLLIQSYYLLDCVDGELARFHRISHAKAAYFDYIAHLLVKPAMFLGLGAGLALDPAVASPWPLFVAIAPMLAVVFTMIAADLYLIIFAGKFIRDQDTELVSNFRAGRNHARSGTTGPPSRLSRARTLALNFDFYVLLFLLAALMDELYGPPPLAPAWLGFKMLVFLFYAVALPLNFVDQVRSDLQHDRMLDQISVLDARQKDQQGR